MILADKITKLRKQQGWSQEELAMRLEVSRQAVSKWESMASLPDLDKILRMSELFGVSTDYLLKDDAQEELGCAALAASDGPAPVQVSLEQANVYLAHVQNGSWRIALAVSLFVLCPVPLIILAGAAECGRVPLTEDIAAAIGCSALILIVAVGLALLLPVGMRLEAYDFLEKEPIATEYGVAGIVEARREAFAPAYRTGLVAGILLCTVSAIPLFITMALENEFAAICAVCGMLACIGVGVHGIVRAEMVWESYQKLLEEGDYTREKKAENKRNDPLAVFYWCLAAALYLGVSFYTDAWQKTWILWPVAGVLFVAILALKKMLRPQ